MNSFIQISTNNHTEVRTVTIESVATGPAVLKPAETVSRPAQAAPVQTLEPQGTKHMDVEGSRRAPEQSRNASAEAVRTSGEAETAGTAEKAAEQRPASNDNIRKAVEELNKKMANSEAIFGIHEKTKRLTIKIINKETKEVIREFPPEKTLDMIAKVWELAGVMVDEKR